MDQVMGSDNGHAPPRNEAALQELNRIVQQAEELLTSLGEAGGEAVATMRARVGRTLHDAKAKIAASSADARAAATQAANRADRYVHANPWRAVAIGAAAGAVAAVVIAGLVRR